MAVFHQLYYITPSLYMGYVPSEYYSVRVLTAPHGWAMFRRVLIVASFVDKVWRTIYYLITLAQRLFFVSYNKYYPKTIHELYSVRVHTAPSNGKSSRIIYYLSTLAQWLFFISYNILPQVLTRAMFL